MGCGPETDDQALVEQCLSGYRTAWEEFYRRFLPLVTRAVEKHMGRRAADPQDTVHEVFVTLYEDLKDYNPRYQLSSFIWTVAKRVCIDEYRMATAAKRSGNRVPVDHHDGSTEGATMVASDLDTPDDQMMGAQLVELVRRAFRDLGKRCGELLKLRYFEGLSFKEMAERLGRDKKTLAVQAGRCIEELRANYARREREGLRQ